jgi:uncharacterized protein
MLMRTLFLLLALTGLCDAHAQGMPVIPLEQFPKTELAIATPDARVHRFKVWVAADDLHRQQGLMFVKSLSDDQGMLFVYEQPVFISLWMKNTFIPLDMVFIRRDGKIAQVVENATPLSLKTIQAKEPLPFVLELKGGTAKKLGIREGARAMHRIFGGPE